MVFERFRKNRLRKRIDPTNVPQHVAIIMDGNGRWAKMRGLPRTVGHNEGGKSLVRVLLACHELGIKALTVYAFSTENWKRPKEEVDYLMQLPGQYIDRYLPMIKEHNIKIKFIDYLYKLSNKLKEQIRCVQEKTG